MSSKISIRSIQKNEHRELSVMAGELLAIKIETVETTKNEHQRSNSGT